MTVLNPRFALPVVPQRNHGEGGNVDWQDLPTTRMVLSLNAARLVDGKGNRYTQDGTAFLLRGYDLKHGDRLPYHGRYFTVIGAPRGDHDHPITGHDFGWVAYNVTGGG